MAWSALAVVFVAGAAWSTFLVLRDAPVGPPGHGAQLQAFLPIVHGEPVLYAGQDRYAAYELLGADTHVPLVEFPDVAVSPNPEKPFDTGDAYSPIDFDSFNRGTLNRFPYVITSRGAWNSEAPPNFKRIAMTADFILWERTGPTPRGRHVLLEGTEAGARAHCNSPEVRILLASGGKATLFGETVIGTKPDWSDGVDPRHRRDDLTDAGLPKGAWDLSLQYFSPFALSVTAPGFKQELIPALDGQRPNTISLNNNGQFWPAGKFQSKGGKTEFTLNAAPADWIQSLTGYDGKAYIGEMVATMAEPRKTVPSERRLRSVDRLVRIRAVALGGQRLRGHPLGRHPHHIPDQVDLLEAVDHQRRDVDLPAVEAVGGGGREGVVAVVEGLAEGRDRDQRQVARLVVGVEVAATEEVA